MQVRGRPPRPSPSAATSPKGEPTGASLRGTAPRALIRQVAAATYHQVWWPPVDVQEFTPEHPPVWDADAQTWRDPDTGEILPTWEQVMNAIDNNPDAQPVHVVRFGRQVEVKGVEAGTKEAGRGQPSIGGFTRERNVSLKSH